MKGFLLCNACGYEMPFKGQIIYKCPRCKSPEIVPTLESSVQSSGGYTKVMVRIIFGVIGGILLISGFILILGALGVLGSLVGGNLPLGVIFVVISFLILLIITNGKILAYLLLALLDG